jgi:hypothetical protein
VLCNYIQIEEALPPNVSEIEKKTLREQSKTAN